MIKLQSRHKDLATELKLSPDFVNEKLLFFEYNNLVAFNLLVKAFQRVLMKTNPEIPADSIWTRHASSVGLANPAPFCPVSPLHSTTAAT